MQPTQPHSFPQREPGEYAPYEKSLPALIHLVAVQYEHNMVLGLLRKGHPEPARKVSVYALQKEANNGRYSQ